MQEVKPTVMNVVPLIIEKIYKKRIKPKLAAKGLMGAVLKLGPAKRKVSRIAGKKLLEAFGGEVRCLCIGGAPISPEVEAFLADSGVPYAIGYGMTEALPAPGRSGAGPPAVPGHRPAHPGRGAEDRRSRPGDRGGRDPGQGAEHHARVLQGPPRTPG